MSKNLFPPESDLPSVTDRIVAISKQKNFSVLNPISNKEPNRKALIRELIVEESKEV